jgi:hypothetical protein
VYLFREDDDSSNFNHEAFRQNVFEKIINLYKAQIVDSTYQLPDGEELMLTVDWHNTATSVKTTGDDTRKDEEMILALIQDMDTSDNRYYI